jgi:hypothetical protein
MNGHVFQCYGEATEKNQFARTTDELDTYVGLHFKKHPIDIKRMIKTMSDTNIPLPKDHEKDATKTAIRVWEKEVDMLVLRRSTYETNKCALFPVIWNQCSESMQAKIKSADNFESMDTESNSLDLLLEIKGIAYKFESQKNIYLALDNAKSAFYVYRQGPEETNATYMSKFKNSIDVIEHYGGNIGDDKVLVTEELRKTGATDMVATEEEKKQAIKTAKSKAHAMAFLKRADRNRYGALITDLENQFTRGNDQYPVSITETYNLLVNYKRPTGSPSRKKNPNHQSGGRGGQEHTRPPRCHHQHR